MGGTHTDGLNGLPFNLPVTPVFACDPCAGCKLVRRAEASDSPLDVFNTRRTTARRAAERKVTGRGSARGAIVPSSDPVGRSSCDSRCAEQTWRG